MHWYWPNSKAITNKREVITPMHLRGKNKEFTKSMKFFHPQPLLDACTQENIPIRSSIDKKMDLLKIPVYDRKKILKKSTTHFIASITEKSRANQGKSSKADQDGKNNDNQMQAKGHYRHKSSHGRKTFQSWFRRNSGNLDETPGRKNIIDIVVMEKEIQRDQKPMYEKNFSAMNFKEKPSKSLMGYQDSQSLLRKNSLYLLNFIKRKESQSRECEPHIGGIRNLASNMRICSSPNKTVKYVPARHQKPKKVEKLVSTYSKIVNSLPIDPW